MEDLLTDKQKLFGKNELAAVANNWGVTEEKAAEILSSNEYKFRYFFNWVNAENYLFYVLDKIKNKKVI